MHNPVHGRALTCTSYDPTRLVTASLRSILGHKASGTSVRIRVFEADALHNVAGSHTSGLWVWHVTQNEEIIPLLHELLQTSTDPKRQSGALRLVFLDQQLSYAYAGLLEAGAQFVACGVPSLQRFLFSAWDKLELSEQGYHPLTSGLSQRLPWPELEQE